MKPEKFAIDTAETCDGAHIATKCSLQRDTCEQLSLKQQERRGVPLSKRSEGFEHVLKMFMMQQARIDESIDLVSRLECTMLKMLPRM